MFVYVVHEDVKQASNLRLRGGPRKRSGIWTGDSLGGTMGQPGLDLVLKMGDIANKVADINYC